VTTAWLAEHLNDPALRILESDEDVLLFDMGHIPNAQKIDWHADLNDQVQRDYVRPSGFSSCCATAASTSPRRSCSMATRTTGGRRTRCGCFELFGFVNARILDGGRMKWEAEGRR